MLEKRMYTKGEIFEAISVKSRQSMKNKLDRYGVIYEINGRGNFTVNIIDVPYPFKVFCLTELKNIDCHTDFDKFEEFLYYFLCDDDFPLLPDETKEKFMDEKNHHISRQTIGKWIKKLDELNWIIKSCNNYVYYFSSKGSQIRTDYDTYKQAWKEYWDCKNDGGTTSDAIAYMRMKYGGVAKKHPLPEQNVLYLDKIKQLTDIVCNDFVNLNKDNSN